MITVRNGVFETNSSSTHCVTIMSKEEFEQFQEGMWYDFANHHLMSAEDLYEQFKIEADRVGYNGKMPTVEEFTKATDDCGYDPFTDSDLEGFTDDDKGELDNVFWHIEHCTMMARLDGIGEFEIYTKDDSVAVSCYIHE